MKLSKKIENVLNSRIDWNHYVSRLRHEKICIYWYPTGMMKYRITCYFITDAIGCGVAYSDVWRLHRSRQSCSFDDIAIKRHDAHGSVCDDITHTSARRGSILLRHWQRIAHMYALPYIKKLRKHQHTRTNPVLFYNSHTGASTRNANV